MSNDNTLAKLAAQQGTGRVPIAAVRDLTKRYPSIVAIDGASLEFHGGGIGHLPVIGISEPARAQPGRDA
jgi:hypothetical protein